MNQGKLFEMQVKKSVPDYALLYRLPDAAQSFDSGSHLRFSRKNPFDYLLWDSHSHILYALELKTIKGKAISFEREKVDVGEIHYHQIQGLNEWNKFDGIVCGFLIEFREIETTIFIDISDFNMLVNNISKKSFTIKDLDNYSIPYIVVPQKKARTRFLYDIEKFLHTQVEKK